MTKSRHILPPRMPWTAEEDETLRRFRGKVRAADFAALFHRSSAAVSKRLTILGLAGHVTQLTDLESVRIRELNARGWSDSEIADSLHRDRHAVSVRRQRLGLPTNQWSERVRDRVRENTRRQLERAGLSSMAELRLAAWRDRARASGWPEDLPWPEQRILNALYAHGPMARRQICEKAGFTWKKNPYGRGSLCGGTPVRSYLAELMRRGLVVYSGRKFRGGGKGSAFGLYSIPLHVALERSVSA